MNLWTALSRFSSSVSDASSPENSSLLPILRGVAGPGVDALESLADLVPPRTPVD